MSQGLEPSWTWSPCTHVQDTYCMIICTMHWVYEFDDPYLHRAWVCSVEQHVALPFLPVHGINLEQVEYYLYCVFCIYRWYDVLADGHSHGWGSIWCFSDGHRWWLDQGTGQSQQWRPTAKPKIKLGRLQCCIRRKRVSHLLVFLLHRWYCVYRHFAVLKLGAILLISNCYL